MKMLKYLLIAALALAPLPIVDAQSAGWLPLAASAGGGGGFTPASLPNLLVWWKADAGVTGSSPVTAVADQSGNSFNLANGSGTGPTLLATGLNGHPTLQFTAASLNFLQTATGVAMGTGSASSCFFVGTYTTSTVSFGRGISYAPSGGNDTDSGATIYSIRQAGTNALSGFNSNNGTSNPMAVTPSTVVHVGMVFSGTTVTPYLGGSAQTASTIPTTVNVNGGLFVIGSQVSGGTSGGGAFWDGNFSEIVCTSDAMTAPNITALEGYFARWN